VRTVKVLRRLLVLLILVLPAFLLTANPAPMANEIDALEGGAKLQAVIDRVVERQRGVRTLQADFVQLKHSELLLEADGDSTRYEFNDLVINSPIDDSRFRLDLGVGVRLQTLDASSGVG
jgi:outer membrane lipoprotein-sorting protein